MLNIDRSHAFCIAHSLVNNYQEYLECCDKNSKEPLPAPVFSQQSMLLHMILQMHDKEDIMGSLDKYEAGLPPDDKTATDCGGCQKHQVMPPIINQAKGFIGSMFDFAKSGFQMVDEQTKQDRLEKCRKCEFYFNGRCGKCGCFMDIKTVIKAIKCPIGEW